MDNTLGIRIKELRSEKNINQTEFAKILNIRNTTLSQYENGINIPNDDMKIKIADYFNVSIDYLLGRSDVKSNKNQIYSNGFNTISTKGLNKDDIDLVKAMVEQLKKRNKHNI